MNKRIFLTNGELMVGYNRLYANGMMWFTLASLISAENFWEITERSGVESFNNLVDVYEYNIYKLECIRDIIELCDKIPNSDQIKIKEKAIEGIDLLTKELADVKTKWNQIKNNNK